MNNVFSEAIKLSILCILHNHISFELVFILFVFSLTTSCFFFFFPRTENILRIWLSPLLRYSASVRRSCNWNRTSTGKVLRKVHLCMVRESEKKQGTCSFIILAHRAAMPGKFAWKQQIDARVRAKLIIESKWIGRTQTKCVNVSESYWRETKSANGVLPLCLPSVTRRNTNSAGLRTAGIFVNKNIHNTNTHANVLAKCWAECRSGDGDEEEKINRANSLPAQLWHSLHFHIST